MERALQQVKKLIYSFQPLEEEEWSTFADSLTFREYKKGDFLVKAGEHSNTIFYIAQGVTRNYFTREAKEFTIDFHFEGEFVSAFHSIITGTPSKIAIEAIQDVKAVVLPYDEIAKRYKNAINVNIIGRKIAEMHYVNRLEKEIELLSLTAEERYTKLMEKRPKLVSTISVKHLSSYLGIQPESLSRIRKLYAKN